MKVNEILSECLDLEDLFDESPEKFNFSILNIEARVALLNSSVNRFGSAIDPTRFSVEDKLYAVKHGRKSVRQLITFTDKDIKLMPLDPYMEMLIADFKKYITPVKFDKLTKGRKAIIFLQEPEWVVAHTSEIPRLTMAQLASVAHSNPSFVDKYISDFSGLTTNSRFWSVMIKYDSKYMEVFLRNANSCVTNTDIREVIYGHPEMIKLLTEDTVVNSKLTVKQWIILMSHVMKQRRNIVMFRGWEFSMELVEMFKFDLTAEILKGESTLSNRLKSSMGILSVTEEEIEEDSNEAETMV